MNPTDSDQIPAADQSASPVPITNNNIATKPDMLKVWCLRVFITVLLTNLLSYLIRAFDSNVYSLAASYMFILNLFLITTLVVLIIAIKIKEHSAKD